MILMSTAKKRPTMKIDAKVEFSPSAAAKLGHDQVKVQVDIDYVEDNEDAVNEWVLIELENMFGQPFKYDDFQITNMDEVIEDIKFDEFESKVN